MQVLLVTLVANIDAVVVATVIGSVVGFLAIFIAFLANTSTTPINDPQLKVGTIMRVTNDEGRIIGHTPVPEPARAPLAPSVPSPTDSGATGATGGNPPT